MPCLTPSSVAALCGLVLLAPASLAREADSREQSAAGPAARSSHALAFHESLHRVLLVGGTIEADSIWAWDGTKWASVGGDGGNGDGGDGDAGPGPRHHFALAYDARDDLLLLHGGFEMVAERQAGARHGDLWAWNGAGWNRIHDESTGPGVRDHHAMVWDRRRGELVLFGGGRGVPGDQTLLGDTWIRDENGWREVTDFEDGATPPPRATHRLAYDEARGRVVLFGGWGDEGLLGDTWEWDGEAWHPMAGHPMAGHPMADGGPEPRFAARLAYDGSIRRTVLVGGRSAGGNLGDTWEWDGETWAPAGTAGPGERNVHALAYDPDRGKLVLHGGRSDAGRAAGTWERHGRRWLRADTAGSTPAGRGAAAGAWQPGADDSPGRLLVFGGIGAEPRAFGDLWSWARAGWEELPVAGGPSPRFNAAGAFLDSARQFVLYGGGAIDERRGDTWILQDGSWREHPGQGPSMRYCARMVHRPADATREDGDRSGDLIFYGGITEDGRPATETWRWDGESWSLLATEGPPGVCFHAMAYDEARRQIVHFGGRGESPQGRHTWIFDGERWRQADDAGPPARDHHAMAWDGTRSEVVLFGGGAQDPSGRWDGKALGDTWTWDGGRWTRRHVPEAPRRFHVPILVSSPYGVLLFGGSDESGSHADLWQWDGERWHRLARDP